MIRKTAYPLVTINIHNKSTTPHGNIVSTIVVLKIWWVHSCPLESEL